MPNVSIFQWKDNNLQIYLRTAIYYFDFSINTTKSEINEKKNEKEKSV